MDIKDSLKKVTDKIIKKNDEYNLEDKVDKFIYWYLENIVHQSINKNNLNSQGKKLRNFIEKIAVWYENRYSNYELNKLIPGLSQEQINTSENKKNSYINNVCDYENKTNLYFFIQSLPADERRFLSKPKYPESVYLNKSYSYPQFHLNDDGIVNKSEGIKYAYRGLDDKDLEGKHIKEVVIILKKHEKDLPEDNRLEKTIEDYDKNICFQEELLNCVMYRIIERGGSRIGPRRAFIFAKEFNRNIDIPMIYAVDYSDPGLRLFINEYIKAGGSKDLECLDGYSYGTKKNKKNSIITVEQLIRIHLYTPEEQEFHERIVNVLANQVNEENLIKEKQLKLKKD